MEAYPKLVIIALVLGLAILSTPMGTYGEGLCGMTAEGLKACKPAVAAENATPPSQECCEALKKADLPCFCIFKKSKALDYYGIDLKKAMQLPVKCNLPGSVNCY